MRTFKGTVSTDMIGSDSTFEFEVEDNATEEEIAEAGREAMFEKIEWYYEEVTEDASEAATAGR